MKQLLYEWISCFTNITNESFGLLRRHTFSQNSLSLSLSLLNDNYCFHFIYRNNPKHWDRQASANSVVPDQTPQNAASDQTPQNTASDQGPHCLPLMQQYSSHQLVAKRTCSNFKTGTVRNYDAQYLGWIQYQVLFHLFCLETSRRAVVVQQE